MKNVKLGDLIKNIDKNTMMNYYHIKNIIDIVKKDESNDDFLESSFPDRFEILELSLRTAGVIDDTTSFNENTLLSFLQDTIKNKVTCFYPHVHLYDDFITYFSNGDFGYLSEDDISPNFGLCVVAYTNIYDAEDLINKLNFLLGFVLSKYKEGIEAYGTPNSLSYKRPRAKNIDFVDIEENGDGCLRVYLFLDDTCIESLQRQKIYNFSCIHSVKYPNIGSY